MNALDLAKAAVARSPKANLAGWCQYYIGLIWETHFGRPTPNSYANATAAYNASKIESLDPAAAPPGAIHYFEYRDAGNNGHDGFALGSDLMASGTSNRAGFVSDLGKGVFVSRVSEYAKSRRYLGWSYSNGNREPITGVTDPNNPPLAKGQRRVLPSANLRIRADRSPNSPQIGNLAANAVFTPEGFRYGEPVNDVDIWYAINGGWAWAGGTTTPTSADLTDLTPEPEPEPVPEPNPEPEPEPNPEPVPEPTPDPEEPKVPIIEPNPDEFEPALVVVTDNVAKYLPEDARGKVYDVVTAVGGIAAAIGASALAVAPAVGGQVGSVIAIVGSSATLVGSLAAVVASRLAAANKQDPIKTETITLKKF